MHTHHPGGDPTYPDLMRTTVTLEPDVSELLDRDMRERRVSFKVALNDAVRRGLRPDEQPNPVTTPVYDLGEVLVDVIHANRLGDDFDDADLVGRLRHGR